MGKVRIELPEKVSELIDTLNGSGFEAFAVGGCVRDSIIGRQPVDWDIATNALPEEVCAVFKKTAASGLAHGTITVILDGSGYEVTTYRTDAGYSDFRHPDKVEFGTSLEGDLKRRDFTINAMAYHPVIGLIDKYDGIGDIGRRIIRTVGNPEERFKEDALRMLRAVRFSAQLGYSVDSDTIKSIKQNSNLITHISIERIRDELTGILVSKNPGRIALLSETGLLSYILPELNAIFAGKEADYFQRTLKPLYSVHRSSAVRWCALLLIAGASSGTAKRLRLERNTVALFEKINGLLKNEIGDSPSDARRASSRAGKDVFRCGLHIRKAILSADERAGAKEELRRLSNAKRAFKEAISKNYPLGLGDLALNGYELSAMGIPEGERLGSALKMLLEAVLENPGLNNKKILKELLNQYGFIKGQINQSSSE